MPKYVISFGVIVNSIVFFISVSAYSLSVVVGFTFTFCKFLGILYVDNHFIFKQSSFISSFQKCILLVPFSCLTEVPGTSIVQNSESRHPCLYQERMYSVFHHQYDVNYKFLQMLFFKLRQFPFTPNFLKMGVGFCQKFFCQLKEPMIFFISLFTWRVTLIDFPVLNQPFISGINPIQSR